MSQGVKQTATDLRMHKAFKAAKPDNLTPALTYGNATTTGPYTGNRMGSTRPEANNQINSLPMGAQIVRCV